MRFTKGKPMGLSATPRLTLVALIDVSLFMLLYFMITSTFFAPEATLASGLRTEKPASGRAMDLLPLVLEVRQEEGRPTFRLGERITFDRQGLRDLLGQLPREGGVVVRVAGDVPVASAATAIQACKDAGFVKVSYVPGR